MPQIVSLSPAAPATPAAAPATLTAVAPVTLLPPDLTSPDFLAQLKSALKNLAGAVALPQIATLRTAAVQNGGPLMSPVSDELVEGPVVVAVADKPVDANMPALLAELGFAIVPTAFVTPLFLAKPAAQTEAAPPIERSPHAPRSARFHPLPEGEATAAHSTPVQAAPDLALPHVQSQTPAPAIAPQPTLAAAQAAIPQPAPTTHSAPAAAPSANPLAGLEPVSHTSPGGSQSDTATNDHARHTPDPIAPIATDTAVVQNATVSDAALVAAAATTAPLSGGPPLTPVGPSAVVSQIARHADLIRLPGNRGLRIQLHPDDLGGVQVTVRYSPAGGVELHINAEHAATGALVQAGWAELRDSLAIQGISADRLMMSVTAPSGAGQADLSGGGGNRSDPSSYSSNQSSQASLSSQNSQDSQGQSRQDTPRQRAAQGWNGPLDPTSSPDGNPRVAAATAAPSRIDYRV